MDKSGKQALRSQIRWNSWSIPLQERLFLSVWIDFFFYCISTLKEIHQAVSLVLLEEAHSHEEIVTLSKPSVGHPEFHDMNDEDVLGTQTLIALILWCTQYRTRLFICIRYPDKVSVPPNLLAIYLASVWYRLILQLVGISNMAFYQWSLSSRCIQNLGLLEECYLWSFPWFSIERDVSKRISWNSYSSGFDTNFTLDDDRPRYLKYLARSDIIVS